MKQYIVLWKDNQRLGSVEKKPGYLPHLEKLFVLREIQTDDTGTVHYEVTNKRTTAKATAKI